MWCLLYSRNTHRDHFNCLCHNFLIFLYHWPLNTIQQFLHMIFRGIKLCIALSILIFYLNQYLNLNSHVFQLDMLDVCDFAEQWGKPFLICHSSLTTQRNSTKLAQSSESRLVLHFLFYFHFKICMWGRRRE